MSMSTAKLKKYLVDSFSCSEKSIKRTSKRKNEEGNIERVFTSDKGSFIVTTDLDDEKIVGVKIVPVASDNGFYFCYDSKGTKDHKVYSPGYILFLITPKKYFDEVGFLSDQGDEVPLDLLEDYFGEVQESNFETAMSRADAEAFLLRKGFIHNPALAKCGGE